jgi:hypothetical protein
MKTNGIRTNRKTLNKSVRKKIASEISLTFDQYENILCSDMTPARICNILKVRLPKGYIEMLRNNKLTKYKKWYQKVKLKYLHSPQLNN